VARRGGSHPPGRRSELEDRLGQLQLGVRTRQRHAVRCTEQAHSIDVAGRCLVRRFLGPQLDVLRSHAVRHPPRCAALRAAAPEQQLRLRVRRRPEHAPDAAARRHATSPDRFLSNGETYFVGDEFPPGDLQVGDHVIFWNNYLFRSIFATDFGLENSVISDIDGELIHSSFVGHGEPNKAYADFADAMLGALKGLFKTFREQITALNGEEGVLNFAALHFQLIPWSPYGERFHAADASQLQVVSAWWMRIKLQDTASGARAALTLSEALIVFPHSVAIDTSKQQPPTVNITDHAADWRESIYLPLSVPNGVRGGWPAYFKAREAGEITSADVALDDVVVDGSWAPGLYFAGPNTKVPVIRPKVRP
jgi:hypothetical protein